MTTEEIMKKERWAAEEALLRGNMKAHYEVFASDAVFRVLPFPEMHGVEAFNQFLKNMPKVLSDLQWNWDEVICKDDVAVQRFTFKGKHTLVDERTKIQPSGKEVVVKGCAVYHIKDGKIVEFLEYSDYLGLYQQLGVIPPLGP